MVAGARALPRIPYDRAVTAAQIKGQSVIEHGASPAAASMQQLGETLWTSLD
jgi:hypothetical protein